MTSIRVGKILGLKEEERGTIKNMYSFEEMTGHKNYNRNEIEKDEFMQTYSQPIGWIIQDETENGLVFIPILVTEENEYELLEEEYLKNIELLEIPLPHSGTLN